MELPLDDWLKIILKVANAPGEPHPLTTRLRKKLRELMEEKLRGRLGRMFYHPLPPLFISLRRERPRVLTNLNPSNGAEAEEFNRKGFVGWMAAQHADALEGAIYALSADPLGKRIRQCDQCGSFFPARRNHRRTHHFCCPDHRRAFDHAHRDPKRQAAYMREYRPVAKARKGQRQKGK